MGWPCGADHDPGRGLRLIKPLPLAGEGEPRRDLHDHGDPRDEPGDDGEDASRLMYDPENRATAQPFLEVLESAGEFARKTVAVGAFRETPCNTFREENQRSTAVWRPSKAIDFLILRYILIIMGHDDWPGQRGFGFGGGGPRGFGRGGRRRIFDAGELALVVLRLMEDQPRHGYDLIREMETRTGGAYAPSPGIIYPTLTLLEDLGQIEASPSDSPRRLFALTQAGRARLGENRGGAEAALARLDAVRVAGGHLESGPVWRAMQNLRAVLEQRLTGPQDKKLLFAAADLIDEAARKIERLS